MAKSSFFFLSYNSLINNNFLNPNNIEEDSIRKGLMYGLSIIGVIFLFLLGTIAFIQGGILLGSLDFLFALLLLGNLFLLQIKGYLQFCIHAGVSVMFLLFMYLFIDGGITGTAFLWSYTFPLFTFFLLGSRRGFIFSSAYFLCALIVLIVDFYSTIIDIYDVNLSLRFIPSFAVVILFSSLYEKHRENSHKALIQSKQSLEKIVTERTKELLEEVQHRKTQEKELRKSEARYKTLYDHSGDGICIINPGGQYISANNRFCQQVGYTEDELKSKTPLDIYFAESVSEQLNSVLTTGGVEFETTQVTRSGTHVPVEIRALPIVFDKEDAILCSCRSIIERKKREAETKSLQERLHRASKMEAIGLMAGGIAHDLNNILAGVTGYPELMLLKIPQDSDLRKPLTEVLESGRRAAAVVAELLTMARGVASSKEAHDCNLVIERFLATPEANKILAEHQGVSVIKKYGVDTGTMLCSPIHFQKCIMNLLLNAVEVVAGKQGARVEIVTSRQHPDANTLNRLNLKPGEYVVINIQDNGPGILKQDIGHIFEPFYSRKILDRSGTGLGLTVVWNVVNEHNGAISVESNEGGTSFSLYFPATDDVEIDSISEGLQWQQSSKHVLVVDDEPQLRDIASKMLATFGYSVRTVSSGEDAIVLFKKENFDLVLLDMQMDPGMNGRQTFEEMLKFRPGQKAILASGFSEGSEVKRALAIGAIAFIRKPFGLKDLWSAVQKCFGPSQGKPE